MVLDLGDANGFVRPLIVISPFFFRQIYVLESGATLTMLYRPSTSRLEVGVVVVVREEGKGEMKKRSKRR